LISHPSENTLELQSKNGNVQDINEQDPDEQSATPLVIEHGVEHDPQLERLFNAVSHPFDGLLSQSPNNPVHTVNENVPVEQSEPALR